jgi:hypothetical protein
MAPAGQQAPQAGRGWPFEGHAHWCQMVTLVGERYDHFRIEQNTVKAFFQKCLYRVFSRKSKESSIYNQILLRFNILVIYQV